MGSPSIYHVSKCHNRETSISPESCHSYFGDYVPLSNLPTPPSSAYDWPQDRSCDELCKDSFGGYLAGPATHLSRLIPSVACLHDPSITSILSFLRRAELPMETVGLAACILDTLSTRFARLWRSECLSDVRGDDQSRGLSAGNPNCRRNGYVEPEVIVLAALSLAVACLDDRHNSTRYWAQSIARGEFTCHQINATRRCILLDLNHQIQPLCTAQLIQETIQDMEQVGAGLQRLNAANWKRGSGEIAAPTMLSRGNTVMRFELPTPKPSPTAPESHMVTRYHFSDPSSFTDPTLYSH